MTNESNKTENIDGKNVKWHKFQFKNSLRVRCLNTKTPQPTDTKDCIDLKINSIKKKTLSNNGKRAGYLLAVE